MKDDEMAPAFIGIPILNRLDLLSHCLLAIDHPAEVVEVNNNATDGSFRRDLERLTGERSLAGDGVGVQTLQQERNLGVAASWNLILRTGFASGRQSVLIGSNDTFLRLGSLAAALAGDPEVGIRHLCAWNFFLIRRFVLEEVGWFDENFYPAYKEDQDYSYRCALAGVRRANVDGAGGEHVGSATINSDQRYRGRNGYTHDWNGRYYAEKWGGDAGQERYVRPFDRAGKDWRWWPDPGASIAERDWDGPDGHV
jgi:GT2 family glycosyltransferase